MNISESSFPYVYGDEFKRSDMHQIIGGSFRHGMTMSNRGKDFLLFHDVKNSKKFGYDKWEGFQADGSFHYTGQGKIGNQKMIRANSVLVKSNRDGIPIHLIESNNGVCTYKGQYVLDDPPYTVEKAPDADGKKDREVFVFKLLPVVIKGELEIASQLKNNVVGIVKIWNPPAYEAVELSGVVVKKSRLERIENELQTQFGKYLIANGHQVNSYDFSFSGLQGKLRPDFWIPCLGLIVEAKPSSTREYVRLAIGQVLDYVNLSKCVGLQTKPAILLPNFPSFDLCTLIEDLGITLISKKNSKEFVFIPPKKNQ